MSSPHFVVIGAGPGGEAAAKRAAQRGARVTLVEKNILGGLCLNWGCIPSKALLEGGRLLHSLRRASDILGEPTSLKWEILQKKKDSLVDQLRKNLTQRYRQLGVRVLPGEAQFVDKKKIQVRTSTGQEDVEFDFAIVATGSIPYFPPPFDDLTTMILDSDRVLSLPRIPQRLLVVGGGAIGCEFACLFQELGSQVTVIEKKETLLPGEDPAITRLLAQSFEKRGMKVHTETTVSRATRHAEKWSVESAKTSSPIPIPLGDFDEILVCVGRRPAGDKVGLSSLGVELVQGKIPVNEWLQTSVPSIYAVGDVNGLSLLAHAASTQGEKAVEHAWGDDVPAYDNSLVPRCLYTWPEVASVGAWAHSPPTGVEVKAHRFFFQGSAKALATGEGEGLIQILSDKTSGRLCGAQIIGPHATELIHVLSVAINAKLTVEQMKRVIFAHPTLSEGIREAFNR